MRTMITGLAALAGLLLHPAAQAQTPQPAVPDPAYLDYAVSDQAAILEGGRRIQLACLGEGSPTVILSAGLGDWGATWRPVHRSIAASTRVCSWDRAGFGLSDPSLEAQTTDVTAADLGAALTAAGIEGPYVMVGHSMGAYETLLFTDRNPDRVVGLVFVDGASPGQDARFDEAAPDLEAVADADYDSRVARLERCAASLSDGSLTPSSADPDRCLRVSSEVPADVAARLATMALDPQRWRSRVSLTRSYERNSAITVDPQRDYADRPIIVLTAGAIEPVDELPPAAAAQAPLATAISRDGHRDLARLSSRGSHRIVEGAGHYIHRDRPDIVAAAVLEVVDMVRADEGTPRP